MIDIEAIDVVASDDVHQAVAGPFIHHPVARAQANAPLEVAHVEGVAFDVLHGIFWKHLAAVTPKTDVSPDFETCFTGRFDHFEQWSIIKAAHCAGDRGVDAVFDFW